MARQRAREIRRAPSYPPDRISRGRRASHAASMVVVVVRRRVMRRGVIGELLPRLLIPHRSQPLPFPLLGYDLLLIGPDDVLHVHGREFVRIIAVGRAARGTQSGLGLLDPVPAPHADLVAALARVELFVGEVELLAAQWAHLVLMYATIRMKILKRE